jgi:hypothetical protein
MGGIYEVRLEVVASGAMIYIPSFIKDWFRHSNVDRRDTQTHRHTGKDSDLKSALLLLENKESQLEINRQQYMFHQSDGTTE